ncbi:MAG: alpha/beta hydrolase [Bacteroidetes bacterium]|nr:alpha/beta hydrolase [Bacteroidota bacterium]
MKKLLYFSTLFFASFFLLVACSKKEDIPEGSIDEYYFVKTDGAVLPVRITGKENSFGYLIMTHGGPGGTAQLFRNSIGVHDLEKDFTLVYWDQRGSGFTQGNSSLEDYNIEQFNKDLDAIVEFVKQVKKSDNIFLLGHSWGGGLTSYYLSNPTDGLAHQAKVKGFVMDAGAYSIVGAMQQSVLNMKAYAAEQTAANKDKQYWKGFDDFITQNPKITADKFIDYTKYVNKAKGVFFAKYETYDGSLPDYESDAFIKNFTQGIENTKIGGKNVFDEMDLTPWLPTISIPTLIIWGQNDRLVPMTLAQPFYNAISTPANKKSIRTYSNCGHEPQTEAPTSFTADVKKFILDNQ